MLVYIIEKVQREEIGHDFERLERFKHFNEIREAFAITINHQSTLNSIAIYH